MPPLAFCCHISTRGHLLRVDARSELKINNTQHLTASERAINNIVGKAKCHSLPSLREVMLLRGTNLGECRDFGCDGKKAGLEFGRLM